MPDEELTKTLEELKTEIDLLKSRRNILIRRHLAERREQLAEQLYAAAAPEHTVELWRKWTVPETIDKARYRMMATTLFHFILEHYELTPRVFAKQE